MPIVKQLAMERFNPGPPGSLGRPGEPGLPGTGVMGPVYKGRAGSVEVLATTIGVGPAAATEATARALTTLLVDHVVVCGIAGAVNSETPIGSLVIPEVVLDGSSPEGIGSREAQLHPSGLEGVVLSGKVLTVGELVLEPDELAKLRAIGVDALEMESAAVGKVCNRLGRPWTVFRSISDRATEGAVDDSVLSLLNEDGTTNVSAALRLIALHPGKIPGLLKLAKDSTSAAREAARAAIAAISTL
jgi:adenosylhomocysteine nucleosidase